MADLDAICAAAAQVLTTATGLRAQDFIPESIDPPAAFVNITRMSVATAESMDITLDLIVLVARSRAGWDQLKAYLSPSGPRSVWLALAANDNLGLTDGTQATLGEWRSLGAEEVAAYGYVGGAFDVAVTT